MANLQQAPSIKYNGDKNNTKTNWGKAIRTHELETAIMCGLGERDMAMLKIMLFLTGNAEGFQVAEKTICERCKISETGYKTARKKLVAKGWITLDASKTITVNYDVILNEYRKGLTENTPINNKKNEGYSENTSMGYSENTSKGYSENTYNNITNTIIEYDNSGVSQTTFERTPLEPTAEEIKEETQQPKVEEVKVDGEITAFDLEWNAPTYKIIDKEKKLIQFPTGKVFKVV